MSSSAVGILAVAIDGISVSSFDALMDPPTATVSLSATLYDAQGTIVESTSAQGQVQRRINTFAAPAAIGQLVDEAVQDAVQRLVQEDSLSGAITRLAAAQMPVASTEAPPASEEAATQSAATEAVPGSPTP